MNLRKMHAKDLNQVNELAAQLGYPNHLQNVETRFQGIQSVPGHALYVATNEAEQILGWVHVGLEPPSLLVGLSAEIMALVVDEKHRSHGVGKALLARAEEWARDQKVTRIRVRSNLVRTEAHRFYLRENYVLAKTAQIFVKNTGL